MISHWLLVIKVEHVMVPQLRRTIFQTAKCQQCYTADISVLFFLSLMPSPFCATKTQLLILEAHFQSLILPLIFFLLGFSQAIGHGESSGEGSCISFHLFLPICCQGVKKMAGSLSSCCHHILWNKKWFCHSMHTAGEKRCWDDQSILFSSADLREIRHKAPRGYRDYGTSHCQSSQSIPLPQLLPTIRTLFCSPVVNKSLQATSAHLLWLTEATLIKTTYN